MKRYCGTLLQCCSIAVSKVAFYCPGSKKDWFVRREWLVVKGVFRIWWRGGGVYLLTKFSSLFWLLQGLTIKS